MQHRSIWALFFCIALCLAMPVAAQASSGPSAQLMQTLTTIRNLGDSSFQHLVSWSSAPKFPNATDRDWKNAEQEIMMLDSGDRSAVLAWLRGNGRSALYARGATDSMIGVTRAPGDRGGATSSEVSKYRVMKISSPTLGNPSPEGGIKVTGGFALIAKDGTKAIICVSFTNVAAVTASAVRFQFPLIGANGDTLGTIDFNRTGEFSPNVAIDGPADANSYFDPGFSHRGAFKNCVTSSQGTAALPLLQARHVAYKVAGVTYTNGSSWP
jgi:hypothetical protein